MPDGPASPTLTVATPDDMHALGVRIGRTARAGDLVVLSGPLGAGKTIVAQGVGAGLDVDGPVTSPTFVVARVHRGGRVPLVHVDAYRLSGLAEVDDLDLDTAVEDSVTVVEWGGGLVEHLADAHLGVQIVRRDDDVREVTLTAHGQRWDVADLASIAGRDGASTD